MILAHDTAKQRLAEAVDIAHKKARRDAARDLLGHQKNEDGERMVRELMKRLKKEGVLR